MLKFKKIVAIVSVILGIIFAVNIASDIQAGFAAVLIVMGLLAL